MAVLSTEEDVGLNRLFGLWSSAKPNDIKQCSSVHNYPGGHYTPKNVPPIKLNYATGFLNEDTSLSSLVLCLMHRINAMIDYIKGSTQINGDKCCNLLFLHTFEYIID
ncbi:hypothetical protein DPMN_193172 [Dreissena polymorpha]|uniref:Uncharacterized protein n=1 Tax=Dreissena polymorpha TaxID=45954 RepID=A0A9D4BDJ7_DREPO|nr:hypothetical protein DPMN_193172 [Dreissena polymorpha]